MYICGFLLGVLAGLYYFLGLWLTVRKVPASANPQRLLASSFLARLVPTLIVMFFAVRYDLVMFFVLLAGFFLVRFMVSAKIKRTTR